MSEPPSGLGSAASTAADLVSALPVPVQTGFIKAMGRLVGGVLATPAAWLRRPAQSVEDKTDAKSLVTLRIAQAVAERAAADPEIVERAMESLVREEFRKQTNKEHVLKAAASEFIYSAPDDPIGKDSADVDDDWMNVFVRYAEDASSERMQKLWGKVLAGEIRKPGAFSLSTIRFLSELDSQTAKSFETLAPLVVRDFIFFQSETDNEVFNIALELESAGLVALGAGMLSKQYEIDSSGVYHLLGRDLCLQIKGAPSTEFSIPVLALTRLGKEVVALLPHYDETNQLKRISKVLEEVAGVQSITLSRIVYADGRPLQATHIDRLWERPLPPQLS